MEARRGRPPYPGILTPAEEHVLDLVRAGLTNAEIAVRLGLSISTVRYHLTNLHAKANSETREALRSWEPADRRRNPLGLLGPLVPGVKWLGVAVGVTVVGIATAAAIATLARQERPSEPGIPPLQVASTPLDLPELDSDRVSSVPTIAVVAWGEEQPVVRLVDSQTGTELARATTGYNPIVTFRRSASELLVSYLTLAPDSALLTGTIDVLDTEDALSLKRRFSVPDRQQYKAYWSNGQILSGDQRYLALSTMTMRTELRECQGGGDGPSCARNGVHILDMESPESWWFELPRYCGSGAFHPQGDSGFVVVCTDRLGDATAYRETFASDGSRSFVAEPLPGWPGENQNPGLSVYADDGWFGMLPFTGSSFTWRKAGHEPIRAEAVPDGNVVRWPIFSEVGGGRLVIGYVPTTGDQYSDGLTVFNMVDGTIEKPLPGFDIARSMVASGPDTLVANTTDGRLIEITVSTGAVRNLATLGVDPENVTLVR